MTPRIRERLKGVSSTVWRIAVALGVISGVIAFVTWATGVWPPVENAVSDLLGHVEDFANIDVEMWHILLVVTAEVLVAVALGVWAFRRFAVHEVREVEETGNEGDRPDLYLREIDYLDVKWPVLAVESLSSRTIVHFNVGIPMCPKHRSTLGMVAITGDDTEEDIVVPLDDDLGDVLTAQRMVFQCPDDGKRFDLRERGMAMQAAKDFVNAQAMGRHRTALANAKAKKRG